MSTLDDIIEEAKQDRELKRVLEYIDARLKMHSQKLSAEHGCEIDISLSGEFGADDFQKLGAISINGGRSSSCDDAGFTPDNHLLADCAEAFYRLIDTGISYEKAREGALVEVRIIDDQLDSKEQRDPYDTLDKVLNGERPRVRALLIQRSTWRSPKRGQKAK